MNQVLLESLEELNILLVDDDPFMQRLLEKVLSDLGFNHIDKAENGQQALDILNHKKIDLLLTDIQMPEMNGLELMKQVRCGNSTAARDLRTIVITSFSSPETLGSAMALDVNGFLEKPFQPINVVKKIMLALSEDEQSLRENGAYLSVTTELDSLLSGVSSGNDDSMEGKGATGQEDHSDHHRRVAIHQLQPGMTLEEEVRTKKGVLLLPADFELTKQTIQCLHGLINVVESKEFLVHREW